MKPKETMVTASMTIWLIGIVGVLGLIMGDLLGETISRQYHPRIVEQNKTIKLHHWQIIIKNNTIEKNNTIIVPCPACTCNCGTSLENHEAHPWMGEWLADQQVGQKKSSYPEHYPNATWWHAQQCSPGYNCS